jgi:hypothetical protein
MQNEVPKMELHTSGYIGEKLYFAPPSKFMVLRSTFNLKHGTLNLRYLFKTFKKSYCVTTVNELLI